MNLLRARPPLTHNKLSMAAGTCAFLSEFSNYHIDARVACRYAHDYDPEPGFPNVQRLSAAAAEAISRAKPGQIVFLSTVGCRDPAKSARSTSHPASPPRSDTPST